MMESDFYSDLTPYFDIIGGSASMGGSDTPKEIYQKLRPCEPGCKEVPPPAPCHGGDSPVRSRPPMPGDGSETATCLVVDDHQARANVGVTKDRGQYVCRIKEEPYSLEIWDLI